MKKHRALKAVFITLACLFLLLLLLVAAVIIFGNIYLNKIDRTEITGNIYLEDDEIFDGPTVDATDSDPEIEAVKKEFEEAQKIGVQKVKGIENILLIGADRHGQGENGRSDSMILISLNHNTGNIHLTSFMRAMYVCIPRSNGSVWSMLNAAYSWGGPNLLVDTIELNFRVKIDKYVVVDFAAFEKAVDLLGGVEIELTEKEAAHVKSNSGVPTAAGKQLLNGAQTRGYCQIRKIDNDFARTARQRKVINVLLQKAKKMDLSTMLAIADEILPMVNTNLTNSEIMIYLTRSIPMLKNPVTQRMLPIENEAGTSYYGRIYVGGREMYSVNFDKNIKALHEFISS